MNKYQNGLAKLKNDMIMFGVELHDQQLEQFVQYYELLMKWNSFMNLTAITDFDEVCTKHFVDSISLCRVVDCSQSLSVIDVGTGAGFPGIPLKVVFPDLKITLLDSLEKRVKFLNEVAGRLCLDNVDTIHGRAEDFAVPEGLREKFDVCVSRAVASLSVLLEYCLPYVKVGGLFVAYKSEKAEEEFMNAKCAMNILGGELEVQEKFVLPSSDMNRNLFVVRKIKPTPTEYPRRAGIPSKKPL